MITGMLPGEAINYKLHMVCTRTDVMYTVWYIQYIYLYSVHMPNIHFPLQTAQPRDLLPRVKQSLPQGLLMPHSVPIVALTQSFAKPGASLSRVNVV